MTDLKLTQEMIAEGMTRPEKVACAPDDSRCYVCPDPLDEARLTCTPKGRCCIGWIVATGGGTDGTCGSMSIPGRGGYDAAHDDVS
jgi:hypothetical protein